ncbi:hypothetical protein GTW69_33695 [Streptomyces sp. SID7760]|nr:hypothetical protein [Streptomyces sp. SID7760]
MPLSQADLDAVAAAVWRHTETNAATGQPVDMGAVMAWMDKVHNNQTDALGQQLAAAQAAVTALAAQLGRQPGVDTETVVAAVRQAIADAVINVDVHVSGTPAPTG